MQFTYADGIANIQLVDGGVRFDLVSIAEAKRDGRMFRSGQKVAVSIPAFLRMQQQMNEAVAKLLEQGVIKKRDADSK